MQFAPVLSPELYPEMDTGRYHMVQAHLIVNNKRIQEWCRGRITHGHTLILDNGAAELGEANTSSLKAVANIIRPSIIVAPDIFGVRRLTYFNFMATVNVMMELAPMVMAVPHGDSVEDSIGCFLEMVDYCRSHRYDLDRLCIGVPKLLDTYEPSGRYWFLQTIIKHHRWPQHQIHLLGINSGLQELNSIIRDFPDIMGIDSTLPYAAGLHSAYLNPLYSPPKYILSKRQWKLTEADVDPGQWQAIKDNIQYCRRYVDGS